MPIIPAIWRTRPTSPEQRLAAAILAQAFSDMFGGAANHGETRDTVDTIAITAMRYLTDRHGQSAHWRNKWCDFLDQDGDVLAVRVRMILEGQLDLPGESRLAVARDRWARISQGPAPSDKPKRLPTIKPAASPKPDPRRLVLDSLREGPKTIREIIFAVNGEIDSSTARVHLMRAVAEGVVAHDIPYWSLRKIAA